MPIHPLNDCQAPPSAASRLPRWTLLLALLLLPGCSLCLNARRTMLHEPAQYSWKGDLKQSVKTYRAWADEAWNQQASGSENCDFEAGFKDGFVDYVYAGGNGEPPPVAPRKYWNLEERGHGELSPSGQWFAGFRVGARAARESGYRNRATIDSSVFAGGQGYANPYNAGPNSEPYVDQFPAPFPYDQESLEVLPRGEYEVPADQEFLDTEELPAQGPRFTLPQQDSAPRSLPEEPQRETTPVERELPRMSVPRETAPVERAPFEAVPSAPTPFPGSSQEPLEKEPTEFAPPARTPATDLDDLFGTIGGQKLQRATTGNLAPRPAGPRQGASSVQLATAIASPAPRAPSPPSRGKSQKDLFIRQLQSHPPVEQPVSVQPHTGSQLRWIPQNSTAHFDLREAPLSR